MVDEMRWGSWLKQGMILVSIMALVSGCFGPKPVLEELGKDGRGKLKVLYSNEGDFFREYGNVFTLKFPNIDIEVVETKGLYQQMQIQKDVDYGTLLTKLIDEQQPDVLTLSAPSYEEYALDGKLYNLDSIIKQEQFDLEGFMPGLIDMVREQGGGALFGLPPFFYTDVLYYNADLFKANSIDLPKGGMTWKDLFDLAARFEDAGMPGLYAGYENAVGMLKRIADTWGLQEFDAKGEHILLESESWKQAYQMMTDAIRTRALQVQKSDAMFLPSSNNLFLQGNAAMTFGSSGFISEFSDPQNKKASKMDWGMVPVPIDPSHPNETPSAHAVEYFAINEHSSNKRAAWEFVKYVNGPEMAKASSAIYYKLPTRTGFVKSIQGKSTEAFYALQIKNMKYEWAIKRVPSDFNIAYSPLREEALQAIIDKVKTVDEALAELQQKAQAALQKVRQDKLK